MEVGLYGDKTHGAYLDQLDFTVDFFCGNLTPDHTIHLNKQDLVRKTITRDGVTVIRYIAYVDTAQTGPGRLYMKMTLDVIDEDYPGGHRPESDLCDCFVNIL